MKKVVVTVGCRPDCIKMMPLVKELRGRKDLETILLSTGQRRQMLDQVFEVFGEKPDYDLAVMKDLWVKTDFSDLTNMFMMSIMTA